MKNSQISVKALLKIKARLEHLNITEVADRLGVDRTNIYYHLNPKKKIINTKKVLAIVKVIEQMEDEQQTTLDQLQKIA